jgi:hypothetical protein
MKICDYAMSCMTEQIFNLAVHNLQLTDFEFAGWVVFLFFDAAYTVHNTFIVGRIHAVAIVRKTQKRTKKNPSFTVITRDLICQTALEQCNNSHRFVASLFLTIAYIGDKLSGKIRFIIRHLTTTEIYSDNLTKSPSYTPCDT